MPEYRHLSAEEGTRSLPCLPATAAGPSTISRELRRTTEDVGTWRPHLAEAAYRRCRQRPAVLERDARLAAYVTDRLAEGWTQVQIAGRLRLGIERGLRRLCAETIYVWIYRAGQKAAKLRRLLVPPAGPAGPARRPARRRPHPRQALHFSALCRGQRPREPGHGEADLVICKRARPVLVLYERKTRLTPMARLAGKTAGETVAAMMAMLRRLDARMRASVTCARRRWSGCGRCWGRASCRCGSGCSSRATPVEC